MPMPKSRTVGHAEVPTIGSLVEARYEDAEIRRARDCSQVGVPDPGGCAPGDPRCRWLPCAHGIRGRESPPRDVEALVMRVVEKHRFGKGKKGPRRRALGFDELRACRCQPQQQ